MTTNLELAASERSTPSDFYERMFVAAVLAAMTAVALGFILRYGNTVPFVDDWAMLNEFGKGPGLSAEFLWSQQNEHRYPVSRLMMWSTWTAADGDLRPSMICGLLPLVGVTWVVVRTARRLRGRAEYTDAFLPLVLLHL